MGTMRLKAAQFVSLVLVMLVTGVFSATRLGLSRPHQTCASGPFLAIGRAMIGNLAPVMPFFVIPAALSQLVLLFQLRTSCSSGFWPSLIALVLFLIATAVTLAVEVPIDNQIRGWTP